METQIKSYSIVQVRRTIAELSEWVSASEDALANEEFGLDISDVREDVKIYFAETCDEQLRALGLRKVQS